MNKENSPIWTSQSSENNKTGTWRSALPNYQNQPSPCHGACPVHGTIAEWIKQVKDGNHYAAWVTLVENNPFPAIAGRICHHPCETACNRVEMDETVGICSLERFVGDLALTEDWQYPKPSTERPEKIAIIGGGPAGLSAAYQLRRYGFRVSLYETQSQLGGLMRYGIPSYRLSPTILDGEIARITAMGIDLHLNSEILDSQALAKLDATHDAVFLATGASLAKQLPGLAYTEDFVLDSAVFLAADPSVQTATTGDHVLVIGGGSAALDVARTARRLGRKVTVLALEPEGKLPAQNVELVEAAEEGIAFVTGSMMQLAEKTGGEVLVRATKITFKPGDAPGKFSIEPISGSDFSLNVNTIIPAIGQDADLSRWAEILDANGPVLTTIDAGWQTSKPGIFAGGDVASMSRFVTHAIGMGKEAAHAIAASLVSDLAAPCASLNPEVDFSRINVAYHAEHERNRQENTAVAARVQTFDEVQQPLSPDAAISEAERCFSCGTCIYCDNCYFYCPDVAIIRHGDSYEVKMDFCKGCGACVEECPTGSIHMREDATS